MVDRVVEPDCVLVERRDLVIERRAADPIATAVDLVECDCPDTHRQARQFRRSLGQADEPQDRHPRDHPERGVKAIRDRLGRIRARREARGPRRRQQTGEEGSADPRTLRLGQNEEHR